MTRNDARRAIDALRVLPALPKVVEQSIAFSSRNGASIDSLTRLVSLDPALTAAVFRLSVRPDESATRACDIASGVQRCLDEGTLHTLLLETALAFPDAATSFHSKFWRHSVTCALLAEEIARHLGDVPTSTAYVAGLTHDIGRLALHHIAPTQFAEFQNWAPQDSVGALALEQRLFGVDHTLAGKWLAEIWRLPHAVTATIWFHHHPAGSLDNTQYPARLLDVIALANEIAHRDFPVDTEVEHRSTAVLDVLRARLAITTDAQESIRRNVSTELGARSTLLASEDASGRSLQRVVSSALRANMRPDAHTALLRRSAEQLRVLHDLEQRLLPGLSLTEIVTYCTEALHVGLEVESGACIVADPSGAFVYGKTWDSAYPMLEDVFVHLDTGEATGVEAMGRRCHTALEGLLAGTGPLVWEGQRIAAPEERAGVQLVPIQAGHWHIGLILLDVGQAPYRPEPAALNLYAKACATAMLRHRAEERLREQSEELAATLFDRERAHGDRANQATALSMEEIAISAAQVFDAPLTTLAGHAQVLLGRLTEPADLQTLKAILLEVRRARSIASDWMAYSRPPIAKLEPCLLNFVLHQYIASRREALAACGITVAEQYTEGLSRVLVDRRQFERVLERIFANAEDAMPDGGVITVRTAASPAQGGASVIIQDTGAGIEPEFLDQVFTPFFTTRPGGERSGLGLSACRGIMRGQGGSIAIQSEPERGTTVILTVLSAAHDANGTRGTHAGNGIKTAAAPEVQAEAEAVEFVSAPLPVIEPLNRPKVPSRVLVVDDDDDLRAVICETLRGRGFAVSSASDGYEALNAINAEPVDLVLLDVHMPRKDGLAVLSELTARHSHIPAIIMSGFLGEEEAAEAIRMGARSCLRKPFRLEVLLNEIEDALPAIPIAR